LPPFDKIKDTDYAPAFAAGMREQLKEIEAIARDTRPPTFENTLVAMERSGQLLQRVSKVFFNLNAANSNPTLEKIELDLAPKLARHRDAILLNSALYSRVNAIYAQRHKLELDPESAQLIERYEQMFERAGARLSDRDKALLKKINESLSSESTRFRQTVLKAMKMGAVVTDNVKDLEGLSPEQIGAAAEAAKARGLNGKWLIALENTTIQPPLAQLKNRALRERIFQASNNRGWGGKTDTTKLIAKMVALRAKKASLLGYPNFAAMSLAEQTAGTPAAVNKILSELAPAALMKAQQEARDIQRQINLEAKASRTKPFAMQPWDWAYYAEKARKVSFGFSDEQVKPYFELRHVLQDGAFHAAQALYGITFTERKDLPVYHPDVLVFEVRNEDKSPLGLLLLDYYKRDTKQGGAWMDTLVDQSRLFNFKPVVINNLNISKPAPGQPTLLTFDEVITLFHEMGHGLHGLFSSVKYPLLSGLNVPADFVELPSQFNEMWVRDRQVLRNFAKHYQTGEPMPEALLGKVLKAQRYGQGYATLEYLKAAMLDQFFHQISLPQAMAFSNVLSFEEDALSRDNVAYALVPPRYRATYFSHIFAGGYEAAYYAYIWSEVLARDAGAWFYEHGGLSRANGDTFRAKILSQGRTKEPSLLFREFYGKEPDIKPLLEYRGLVLPEAGKKK
jgi:peptidyl-dipeptidase Dcp